MLVHWKYVLNMDEVRMQLEFVDLDVWKQLYCMYALLHATSLSVAWDTL